MDTLVALLSKHPWMLYIIFAVALLVVVMLLCLIIYAFCSGCEISIIGLKIKNHNLGHNDSGSKVSCQIDSPMAGETVYLLSNGSTKAINSAPPVAQDSFIRHEDGTKIRPDKSFQNSCVENPLSETPEAVLIQVDNNKQLLINSGNFEFCIGRSEDCNWYIPYDEEMSRHHFRITLQDRQASVTRSNWAVITDLASSNGTTVCGQLLIPNIPTALSDGATIQAGETEFVWRYLHCIDANRESQSSKTEMAP